MFKTPELMMKLNNRVYNTRAYNEAKQVTTPDPISKQSVGVSNTRANNEAVKQ